MKVHLEKNDFLAALGNVQSVVERRNTIPILSNVLLEARDGKVFMTATDTDIEVVDCADATVSTQGTTTTPASIIFDIVRKLPEGAQVLLELDNNELVVSAGRSKFTLPTLPIADFPAVKHEDMPHTFKIPSSTLAKLIESTRFAASTEETRYYLNGIYFHAVDTIFCAVATDGHRLAKAHAEMPQNAEDIPGIIVPRKTIGELHKLLEQTDGEVNVSLSKTKIQFSVKRAVLTSNLVDATFPEYERVIPKGNPEVFQVDCNAFKNAVDRVSTVAAGKMRPIKMRVADGLLSLHTACNDMGTGLDEIEVKYTGTALEIGYNARYLLDIMAQISSDMVTFEVKDGSSPSVIREANNDSAIYVLMPMRV